MNLIENLKTKFSYLICFIASSSWSLLIPVIPIYILFLGASQFEIGLLGGFDSIAYVFASLLSILISRYISLKKILISSILLSGLSCILFTFIKNPYEAFLVIILRGFSTGFFWPIVEALLSKDFKIEEKKTISKFTLSWSIGAIFGSSLSGPLMEFFNLKQLFYLTGLPFIFLSLISIFLIKEGEREEIKGEHSIEYGKILKLKDAWLLSLIYGFLLGIIFYLFPAYIEIIGFSQIFIGITIFSFFIFRALFFWLYQKIFMKYSIEIGLALCGLGFLNIFLIKNPILIILGSSLIGIGTSIIYSISLKMVFSNIKNEATILTGFFEAILAIGFLLGPLVGGLLAEKNLVYPYLMGFLISIFSIILLNMRRINWLGK
jgi:DHA1 family multidrug resistance protein-like MFS transporter